MITSLDEFVLDFTHIFKERIDNVLLKKFMKALHVRGDKYGIEV